LAGRGSTPRARAPPIVAVAVVESYVMTGEVRQRELCPRLFLSNSVVPDVCDVF